MMSDYDFEDEDRFDADDEDGEFGFDYDNNDVLYHYGDGFATAASVRSFQSAHGLTPRREATTACMAL